MKLKKVFLFTATVITCFINQLIAQGVSNLTDYETNNNKIADELQQALELDFSKWYPLTIDSLYGGFFSDVNYKWELEGRQTKMIVTQARHVWSSSNASEYFPQKQKFIDVALHGYKYLRDVLWDKEFGGFYNLVDRQGNVIEENGEVIKRAYGNSFALYALAALYRVTRDEEVLTLAKKTFEWFETNSFDPEYGGYFQFISRDGNAYKEGYGGVAPKDQNTMIHILESFTELYKVWPDSVLRERLLSVLFLIRDKIVTPKGYMNLFFTRDWQPISFKNASPKIRNENFEFDHVSFGHDIEIAYLMLEACEVLGIENDASTLRIAKKMADHSIKNGFDLKVGGLFDRGYYFDEGEEISIIKNTKEWWSQAEALNSLLLMSKLFPNDENNYYDKFCLQWNYIKKYLLDHKFGGWYWGGIDIEPQNKFSAKSSIWKGNYHTSRALINCVKMLNAYNK